MRRFVVLLAGLLVVAFLNAGGALASGQGLLNAVAYRPMAAGESIAVRPLDNSDDNLILQKLFERELSARGYSVSENAALVLSFETRGVVGAWASTGRRSVLELEGHGGQEGGENAKLLFNLYNSNRGGVFNAGKGGTAIMTPSQYRLDVTIDNRGNGKRLWQAWTVAELEQFDGLSLVKAMVPVLVRNLGRTVKRQPFDIP